MQLLFKQRFFSWLDSYDIYDEAGHTVYTVKGQLAWGHCLKIFDADDHEVGCVRERVFTFLPRFELYQKDAYIGCVSREWSFFRPRYRFDCNGWTVEGDFMEWDYRILSGERVVADISKTLFKLTDTYVMDIKDPADALTVLMFVLAIDAEKCSRN